MSIIYSSYMIIISLSILFTQMTHPLALGMTLLLQTVIVCGTTAMLTKTAWFSYILFLIFLGAMLVLFIYVASLAPNEASSFSPELTIFLFTLMSASFVFFMTDPLLTSYQPAVESSFMNFKELTLNFPASLSPLYSPQTMNLTLFIILYLLLTLIVAVKIASTHFGALRLK